MRLWLAGFAILPVFCQQSSSLPSWLATYPGATATVHASEAVTESSYTTSAQTDEVLKHYRSLFEAKGLTFEPNPDGVGTSFRGSVPECDLLIQIRSRSEGTFVKVNCSARTQSSSAALPEVVSSRPQIVAPRTSADFMERHRQIVAEMGIHREQHDAPAPPLVWPAWLVHVNGTAVRAEAGVDQSKNAILKAKYKTNAPMTEIYRFYRELLAAHEYPTRSSMSTGQTITGVTQNALGYVEGSNYPDGSPGAYSEIKVSFDRDVLNGPITVSLRFTTHEYIASRGY